MTVTLWTAIVTALTAITVALIGQFIGFRMMRQKNREDHIREAVDEARADSEERITLRKELRAEIQVLREHVAKLQASVDVCHEERDEYKLTMLRITAENKLLEDHAVRLEDTNKRLDQTIHLLTNLVKGPHGVAFGDAT